MTTCLFFHKSIPITSLIFISVEQDLFGGISSSDEETEVNPLDDSNSKAEASYTNDSMTGADDMTGVLSQSQSQFTPFVKQ